MGKYQLIPHQDALPEAIEAVEVDLDLSASEVCTLWYTVFGRVGNLVTPPEKLSGRADHLWKTTCFEMFVQDPSTRSYSEFNFSPSTEWAAYRFNEYRSGMVSVGLPHEPIISSSSSEWFEMHVTLPLDFAARAPLRLGLSAVIEEKGGRKSYWALAHPPGKADFHHPDSFVCELP